MRDSISTLSERKAIYGQVGDAARLKETDRIIPEYQAFIEACPFAALSTVNRVPFT
jgi:uncharacterized protein